MELNLIPPLVYVVVSYTLGLVSYRLWVKYDRENSMSYKDLYESMKEENNNLSDKYMDALRQLDEIKRKEK